MLAKYTKLLIKHPYPTKMLTSGIVFVTSDFIVQKFIEKKKFSELSIRRMAVGFAVGGFYLAPWIHIWFSKGIPAVVSKLPGSKKIFKNMALTALTFTAIDQTINSP